MTVASLAIIMNGGTYKDSLHWKFSVMASSKQQLLHPGNSPQIIATAISGILSLFTETAPIAVAGSIGILCWQNEQVNKFKKRVEIKFSRIESQLLDFDFINSPKFMELCIQTTEAAAKTASDQKHKALANALVASAIIPTSQFSNKSIVTRILGQISEEELIALQTLFDIEDAQSLSQESDSRVFLSDIRAKLGWSDEDVLTACQGLVQLGLTTDKTSSMAKSTCWNVTTLAKKILQFITDIATD
jgi:hypothetical protein